MTSYYYGLIESKIYQLEEEIKEKTEELKRLKDLKNHYDEANGLTNNSLLSYQVLTVRLLRRTDD